MPLIRKTGAALIIAAAVAGQAQAQSANTQFRGTSLDAGAARLKTPKADGDLASLGKVVAPGVVLSNYGYAEIGFDTNPDELYSRSRSTVYGTVGGSSALAFVTPGKGATVLMLQGSSYNLADTDFNHNRGDIGGVLDASYSLGKGFEISYGAYALYDALKIVESEQAGGYAKLAFSSENFEAYVRVREQAVKYLGDTPFLAGVPLDLQRFFLNQTYNVRRTEETVGALQRLSGKLAVFADLGAAQLDYFNQPANATFSRSADDYWAIAGIRLQPTRALELDIGVRYNERDFHQHALARHNSIFPDVKLSWWPTSDFGVSFDVTRLFVEPVTAFALMGDETTYGITVRYYPIEKLELAVRAHERRTVEVADNATFEEFLVGLTATYTISDRFSVYGIVTHKHVEETFSDARFDRTVVGVGTSVKF